MSSNDARGTDWVDITVMVLHGSPNVTPNETLPSIVTTERSPRKRNFRFHSAIHERSSGPRRDQSTARDKNKILHALDTLPVLLGPGEPTDYMVFDVIFKHFCMDNICTTTPVGKK
jgi:hypothetical protein